MSGTEHAADGAGEEPVDWVGLANWLIGGVVVALVAAYMYRYAEPGGVEALVDRPAPGFEVDQLGSDSAIGVDDYRGRVVVLDFWATWCPPCHEQMPHLAELAERPEVAEDLQILSVNADRPGPNRREKVRAYLERRGLEFPTALDDGTVQEKYRVRSFPTTVVIGPDGEVTFAESGVHDADELEELVEGASP